MQTATEIAEKLGQAADNMRKVSKAAQDMSARNTAEPSDVPQPPLGDTIPGASITGKPQG